MATDFDFSEKCRETIHKLLTENTTLNGLNSAEERFRLDYRTRESVIFAIFRKLRAFEIEHKVKDTFWLTLRGDRLTDSRKANSLFMGIANAICKNRATDFHSMDSSDRYVFSWKYNNYDIKAYSKRNDYKSFFMTIINTHKVQDGDAESGKDTDDDRFFLNSSKESLVYSLLQSMHDRINELEASYSPPASSW
jgi:hypothetical protein